MHPREFWWLVEARKPVTAYGKSNSREIADIYDDMVALGEL